MEDLLSIGQSPFGPKHNLCPMRAAPAFCCLIRAACMSLVTSRPSSLHWAGRPSSFVCCRCCGVAAASHRGDREGGGGCRAAAGAAHRLPPRAGQSAHQFLQALPRLQLRHACRPSHQVCLSSPGWHSWLDLWKLGPETAWKSGVASLLPFRT